MISMNHQSELIIDGSLGEGGGQILRTALSLSMHTGRPVRVEHIRAGRPQPGLLRQHLTCLKAAQEISNAQVAGDAIGSQTVVFQPQQIKPGEYYFAVGTAGSTGLVLQTLLPILMFTQGTSVLHIEGGTHNPSAPSYDFLQKTYLPVLYKLGAKVSIELQNPGFYPAGGGNIVVRIEGVGTLQPLELLERGSLLQKGAFTRTAIIPETVSERELQKVRSELDFALSETESVRVKNGAGPGNALAIWYQFEHICELFNSYAEKKKSSEAVASNAIKQANDYLKSDAPVGAFLADQLLLPLALGNGGRYLATRKTRHFSTHTEIIQMFLDVNIHTEKNLTGSWLVDIQNEKTRLTRNRH